jgi:hypothetical protein
MMREFKITASRMNINWILLENFSSHGRAFNMPSWTSSSPR